MSTRALYTFTDSEASWNVYKHHDGYLSGAADTIGAALKWFAWRLPRFEADEFAAAFCAAGKAHQMINAVEKHNGSGVKMFHEDREKYGSFSQGGGVRFMPQGDPREVAQNHCSDIEYRYEIMPNPKPSKKRHEGNDLYVRAFAVSARGPYNETLLFKGSLDAFFKFAARKAA